MRATLRHHLSLCALLVAVATTTTTPAGADSSAAIAPSAAGAPPIGLSFLQQRLANGLTVVIQEDHRNPLVSLVLRYDVGERMVPEGLRGLAGLTDRLMSTATKHVAKGEASRLLYRAGAGFSARTFMDATERRVTLPAHRLELPLWLWSDQMGFFREALGDDLFEAERDAMRDRRRADLDASPLELLDGFAEEELYPRGHPYRPGLGWPESVAGIGRADVLAFHDRWMTPLETLATRPARYASRDSAELMAAAARWLEPSRMRVVLVGDWAMLRKPLESLGWGPIEVRSSDGTKRVKGGGRGD